MGNRKNIGKLFVITLMMYIITFWIAKLLGSEKNLSSLKNGHLLIGLFYGQLILIID